MSGSFFIVVSGSFFHWVLAKTTRCSTIVMVICEYSVIVANRAKSMWFACTLGVIVLEEEK